ncbi:MAG: S8 family serine peptidase [Chitinophagaceae bacterium]|nr:S8 family serine peptidase [Chitinophagaceae bacterium]
MMPLTGTTGIASGATNNGTGISSIGFSCKLMGVTSRGDDPDALPNPYAGVLYAATAGANIINMSWGGSAVSQTAQSIIDFALGRGCILVASAGNENTSTERYPAAYAGVISVASTTATDAKSSFSNYGSWVKISAPGSAILSSEPFSDYGFQSGTSMSTPMVAGLLGLMKSFNPGLPNSELINCLYSSADNIDALNPGFETWLGAGRINAANAMACVAASLNNPPVADFSASTRTIQAGNTINFIDQSTYNPTTWSWSFPGGTPATSNVKNPNNIRYNTPGTYAVTLTVTNANGQDTETKTNYITVTEPSACFSVNIPQPSNWTPTIYTIPDQGYLNGTNNFGDKQKAMYFDVSNTQNTSLTRVLIAFSHANSTNPANLTKTVTIRVFDGSSGNSSAPGAELRAVTRTLAQIREDVLANRFTTIDFLQNIPLPASKRFFISVDISNLLWNASTKDSLNIVSNNYQTQGDGSNDLWEQWSDDTWTRYDASYNGLTGMKLYIHPQLTATPTNVVLNPKNPGICSGGKVDFTAASSTLQAGQPFQWQLAGTTPNLVNNSTTHTAFYNTAGSFKAYLVALGVCNEFRVDSTVVTVSQTPALNVTASKNPICQGETATLSVTGAGSYSWTPSTGLNTTQGNSVQANPATTTSYTITGVNGSCTGSTVFELEVRALTTSVSLSSNPATITQPTSVTFTASALNGGSSPVYNFKVNGQSVQSGSSNTLVRQVNVGDKIICEFTSSETCVTQKTVNSNELTMGEVLPVFLTRFTGRKTSNANLLEWTTAAEINSREFVVERGNDGVRFEPIGNVAAAGNTSTSKDYSLLDPKFEAGKNFYRLKMIDLDGTFRYSRTVMIDNSNANLITTLSPNPARSGGESLLQLNGLGSAKINITILDVTGASIRNFEVNNTSGNMQVRMPVQNLSSGTYIIVVKDEKGEVIKNMKWNVVR